MDPLATSEFRLRADRLRGCPFFALRSECETFLGLLKQTPEVLDVLKLLETRVGPSLNEYPRVTENEPKRQDIGLQVASSAEQRALLGFRLLDRMLKQCPSPDKEFFFSVQFCRIGGALIRSGDPPPIAQEHQPLFIETFVKAFVDPIIDYIGFTANREDRLVYLMTRYKRRAEWFHRERLLQVAKEAGPRVEEKLKLDFYEYLFDKDLELYVEPGSPGDASKVDVLSAHFADGSRLVCEVKVYDGENRDRGWVGSGISQAADYANQWGEAVGYLLVYNIEKNARLSFIGSRKQGTLWTCDKQGRRIHIVALDLAVVVPASKSHLVKDVGIQC